MKRCSNLALVILICLASVPVAGQGFRGQIAYTIMEKDTILPFCTYTFNEHFIKKTDTAYSSLFVTAGFTEIIWDLREKKQYLINHGTKVVYYRNYQGDKPQKNFTLSATINRSGYECATYEITDTIPVSLNDRPDTFFSASSYTVALAWKLSSPPQSEARYDPLRLSSGYIPLYISSRGRQASAPENNYHTVVEAVSIGPKDIGDTFFRLPEGYEWKPYNEQEIRDLLSKAAGKKIDFMEMARKIMRQRGMFPILE